MMIYQEIIVKKKKNIYILFLEYLNEYLKIAINDIINSVSNSFLVILKES